MLVHFCSLIGVAWYGDPTNHLSIGIHQEYGPCNVVSVDYAGGECHKYVCDVMRHHSYSFHCGTGQGDKGGVLSPKKKEVTPWYAVCGLPKEQEWTRTSLAYSIVGMMFLMLMVSCGGVGSEKVRSDGKRS